MDQLLQWLPAIIAAGSAIWMVASMNANQAASAEKHISHKTRLDEHEGRIRAAENAITGLKVFDELQSRRKENDA